jgi:glycosyltransferase involved in cell wall biosynthesis
VKRDLIKVVTERCGVRVNPRLGSALYRKVEDFFTRFADWVIPNSKAGEKYVIDRGIDRSRVSVIYNGINLQRLNPNQELVAEIRQRMGVPADGKVIGITASLTPAKDHATFLQAASIVAQAAPQTRFGILGDGPLRPDLEEMARRLGIEKSVTFFGNQRDVGSYISVYDIACLASFDHEGCSNATLEAMAMGKPVVVTDIGGNREIVERNKTGLMVPPKSPQIFADAILSYLEKPELAKQMGDRARQFVLERFSVSRMVSDYQDLYERAIEYKEQSGNKSIRSVTVE